jgi:hypothetical protein
LFGESHPILFYGFQTRLRSSITEVRSPVRFEFENPLRDATIHCKVTDFDQLMAFDPSRAGKTYCACGNEADTFGGLCDRCVSLQVLGLTTDASPEQIESTYLILVKVWHPDRFAHDLKLRQDAEEKLKEINSAHDYLLANPTRDSSRSGSKPDGNRIPQDLGKKAADASDSPDGMPDEVQRILRRQQKSHLPPILVKAGFGLAALTLIVVVGFTADSFLSTNEHTMRAWLQLKTELGYDFRSKLTSNSAQTQSATSQPAQSVPPAPSAASGLAVPTPPQPRQPAHGSPASSHGTKVQPYITAGLTPMEVLSVLGKPTSSTGEKMLYNGSEIDFKNGQVAGWKLDPTAPIRVKLWPDTPLAPGLTTFGRGSSRSDVIAVQGTPTLFSDNEFGYDSSLVFFQNGHVTGWKEDPASTRLHVPR